jgi:hypothetical protein
MALWDKVRVELDRAGRAAQTAIDEGREGLELVRARRRADRAAQELGYAVYRARKDGRELDPDSYARLSSALAACEAEVTRHESRLATIRGRTGRTGGEPLTGTVHDAPASPPPGSSAQSGTP